MSHAYIGQVRQVLLVILIVLVGLSANADGSSFRFVNGDQRQNDQMRVVLDAASQRLTKLLDVVLPETLTIATVETQQQFDSLAVGRMPDWGAGAAVPARNLILLRGPMMNRYPGSLSDLLEHELAHIALHTRVQGQYVPRFIDEGFASWFAGEWTFSNITAVAAAQLTNSILPLETIDDVNTFREAKANLAYSQSYLVVLYIYQRFGELGFTDLLDAFAAGKNTYDAFRSSLMISFWDFERDYREFLDHNYTVFTILSNSMGFWIILAAVVIVGYLVVRKRKKDTLDRWKEQEKYESTDFDYTGSDDEPWKNPNENDDPGNFSSYR